MLDWDSKKTKSDLSKGQALVVSIRLTSATKPVLHCYLCLFDALPRFFHRAFIKHWCIYLLWDCPEMLGSSGWCSECDFYMRFCLRPSGTYAQSLNPPRLFRLNLPWKGFSKWVSVRRHSWKSIAGNPLNSCSWFIASRY